MLDWTCSRHGFVIQSSLALRRAGIATIAVHVLPWFLFGVALQPAVCRHACRMYVLPYAASCLATCAKQLATMQGIF